MVYFLKFGAGFLLPPGIFVLALALLCVAFWRHALKSKDSCFAKGAAAFLTVLTAAFYLYSSPLVAEVAMSALEGAYEPPKNPQGDVIIMLGGGAYSDTPDVSGAGTLCSEPANRLLTAARLQRELNVPILLSGGQVYEDTGLESAIARRCLMDLGIAEDMILVEDKSINTTENARFSADILREHGLTSPILVTSAYHMRRSVLNFEKQGLKVTAYPADYLAAREHSFHYVKLAPTANAIYMNTTVIRETVRTLVTRYME